MSTTPDLLKFATSDLSWFLGSDDWFSGWSREEMRPLNHQQRFNNKQEKLKYFIISEFQKQVVSRPTVNNQASFVKTFLGDSSFKSAMQFHSPSPAGITRHKKVDKSQSAWSCPNNRAPHKNLFSCLGAAVNLQIFKIATDRDHRIHPVCCQCLLGQVPESSNKVQHLNNIKPTHSETSGSIISPVNTVGEPFSDSSAGSTHEVVEEVVHQLHHVHDGLRALDDLSVERSLDIRLKCRNINFVLIIEIVEMETCIMKPTEKNIFILS